MYLHFVQTKVHLQQHFSLAEHPQAKISGDLIRIPIRNNMFSCIWCSSSSRLFSECNSISELLQNFELVLLVLHFLNDKWIVKIHLFNKFRFKWDFRLCRDLVVLCMYLPINSIARKSCWEGTTRSCSALGLLTVVILCKNRRGSCSHIYRKATTF